MHRIKRLKRPAVVFSMLGVSAIALAFVVPLPERLSQPPSTVVLFEDDTPAFVFLAPDERYRLQASIDSVDPDYLEALIRYEDKRFRWHAGVDPIAAARALWLNVRHQGVVSGGSTITMQLVRLLEPRPRRLSSKAIEAFRAMQLEVRLSKAEILSAYVSFISFGRNLEGVEAASFAYFSHSATELTAAEIVTLLAVPQKPAKRFPHPDNRERLLRARNRIAKRLVSQGVIREHGKSSEVLLEEIRSAPIVERTKPLPRHAAHAAFWLKAREPQRRRFETTLDRGAQRMAEALLRAEQSQLAARGIHNGAVVVIEHESSRVRALVGNFDFFDARHGGQIIGFQQPRSTGSALKPFIYALGLDRGLILPEQLTTDVPVTYGGYSPNNYDGRFAGLVTMESALAASLNVPFVRVLSSVGVERFVGLLSVSGVVSLDSSPGYYGLSAAIGAMELTPLELASLYSMLAQHGRFRPARVLREMSPESPRQVLSSGASYLTRRALASRDRPDFPSRRRFSGMPARIHWKTGTSYGHRDAWAAGSGDRYSAVVWLGNFDNTPSFDLVGADASGPILFDLLEALSERSSPPRGSGPSGDLAGIEVCAYSGHVPGPACPETKRVLALRTQVPPLACPYHIAVDVDVETGEALNPTCYQGRRYERRSFMVWPATVRRWLSERHRFLPTPPTLAGACRIAATASAPVIVSPQRGLSLVLLPGVPASDQEMPLEAEAQDSMSQLSWFVDGEFLGTSDAAERVWWTPSLGDHEFLVTNRHGQSDRMHMKVRSGTRIAPLHVKQSEQN